VGDHCPKGYRSRLFEFLTRLSFPLIPNRFVGGYEVIQREDTFGWNSGSDYLSKVEWILQKRSIS
jgi:hypothetical protein